MTFLSNPYLSAKFFNCCEIPLVVILSPNLFKNKYPLSLFSSFNHFKVSFLSFLGIYNLRSLPPLLYRSKYPIVTYNIISRDYGKRYIVNHYYDKDQPLPIWAIFELLTLGEFGNFISCLNITARKTISKSIGIKTSVDGDGQLLTMMVYVLKDLRNAVAHNNTIFDTRFKTGNINTRIANYISAETGISNLTFNTIVDYMILISFLMKLLQCPKSDIMSFVHKFEQTCESFRKTVSTQIYTSVVYTDTRQKIALLKNYQNKRMNEK